MMRPLCEQYGAAVVDRVGRAALGYPPQWIHTFSEARQVTAALFATGGN